MFTHPDHIGQKVNEHHRRLIEDASQCRQHDRLVPTTPSVAAKITRRLVATFAKAGAVAVEAPGR
jgi:hypothetical protein